MIDEFSRTKLIFGDNAMMKLKNCKIAVFGIGGVGGHAVEALVRSGVGAVDIIDNDTVSSSNINRQIIALHSTIGEKKVDVMEKRLLDINPDVKIGKFDCFVLPDTIDKFDFSKYDYVLDAIDTISGKIAIIMKAKEANVPVISSMGAGNKLDATRFSVTDIFKTSGCPLARVMRQEMKKRGVRDLKVVFSDEPPVKPLESNENSGKRQPPGSLAFVPSVAGLIMAGEVILDLVGGEAQ